MLRREDGNVFRRALHIEVEGRREKLRLKRKWKKQVEEQSVKVGLSRGLCTLSINVECWRQSDCCWVEVNLAVLT